MRNVTSFHRVRISSSLEMALTETRSTRTQLILQVHSNNLTLSNLFEWFNMYSVKEYQPTLTQKQADGQTDNDRTDGGAGGRCPGSDQWLQAGR